MEVSAEHIEEDVVDASEVIMDNDNEICHYEITVPSSEHSNEHDDVKPTLVKIVSKRVPTGHQLATDIEKPNRRKNCGRRKKLPEPKNATPIKILPKPIMGSVIAPKLLRYVEDPKLPKESRSATIDKLIEKVLKENTNEIDVFFRSMAASVKKLQPNLIPKVKMEVCNVIAKYEMQNYEKNSNS